MSIIQHLLWRVDAADGLEDNTGPVRSHGGNGHFAAGGREVLVQAFLQARDVEDFFSGQSQACGRFPGRNWSGNTPIPTRLLR